MKVIFKRIGGFSGIKKQLILDTDKLSQEEGNRLETLVIQADFFDLPLKSISYTPAVDRFYYIIRIEEGKRNHQIEMDETEIPTQLHELVAFLIEKAKQHSNQKKIIIL